MAQTLFRAADSDVLKSNRALELRRDGFRWYVRNGVYSVTDGKQTLETPLQWAFGPMRGLYFRTISDSNYTALAIAAGWANPDRSEIR